LYKIWVEFISCMEIFPLGYKEAKKAAEIYNDLEANGTLIDDNDILIADTILSNGTVKIITKNAKPFEKSEGIAVIPY